MRTRDETTATFHRSRPPGPIGVLLRVTNRPAKPRELRLLDGSCVLGAGRDVDLIIDDETVSRRHVELSLVPEGVAVTDLGSHNGTYYLGQRIENGVLAIGSTLYLGRAEIKIDADVASLTRERGDDLDRYGDLVGASPGMRKLFALLARLESSLVNVLVEGESGTGKELIARAIHDHSPAAQGPFVAVNCGAMDRALVRSELFGHKRGAFTGALEARVGAFEAAASGTLFLDEVGELPLDVQPVLLRSLETGTIVRVGEHAERPVKVRIVAATNRDLAEEVKAGRFREDLYFRLMVIRIRVPPLRERPDDVVRLAEHFAMQVGFGSLPSEIVEELKSRTWTGNARELKNAVQAFAVLGALPELRTARAAAFDDALRGSIDLGKPYADQKAAVLRQFLRVYLETLLTHTGGNQSHAARISGIERSYLNRMVQELKSGAGVDSETTDE